MEGRMWTQKLKLSLNFNVYARPLFYSRAYSLRTYARKNYPTVEIHPH